MAHVIRSSFVLCPPSIVRMRCAFHAEKFGGLVGQNFMENYDYLCKVIGGFCVSCNGVYVFLPF